MYSLKNIEHINFFKGLTLDLIIKYQEHIQWDILHQNDNFTIDWVKEMIIRYNY